MTVGLVISTICLVFCIIMESLCIGALVSGRGNDGLFWAMIVGGVAIVFNLLSIFSDLGLLA